MADEPLTLATLTRFHRETVAPDFQRIIRQLDRLDSRLEMVHGKVEGLCERLEPFEKEYRLLVGAVHEIEGRLEKLEGHIDRLAVRSELETLRDKVNGLQDQIRELERRLKQ
jgi:predicted  nucleic acid-binding Zn-ribbon protein